MKPYLEYDEFLEIGEELECGQDVRVNHSSSSCDGDSKSMIIKRKDNGDISAYCFRCGRSGYHSRKTTLKSKTAGGGSRDASSGLTASGREYKIPSGSTGDTSEWPVYASHWIRQSGITDEEVKDYGLLYSDSIDRVILPVYDKRGVAFYQTRKVNNKDSRPKYLTFTNRSACNSITCNSEDRIILVEDFISGIKVGRQFNCLVLHGTVLLEHHIKYLISNGYRRFVVWLDDDNLQVKRNTLKIKRELDKLGKCTVVHTYGKDPKEHSDKDIKEIVDNSV